MLSICRNHYFFFFIIVLAVEGMTYRDGGQLLDNELVLTKIWPQRKRAVLRNAAQLLRVADKKKTKKKNTDIHSHFVLILVRRHRRASIISLGILRM